MNLLPVAPINCTIYEPVIIEFNQTCSAELKNQAWSHPAPLISEDHLECKGGVFPAKFLFL